MLNIVSQIHGEELFGAPDFGIIEVTQNLIKQLDECSIIMTAAQKSTKFFRVNYMEFSTKAEIQFFRTFEVETGLDFKSVYLCDLEYEFIGERLEEVTQAIEKYNDEYRVADYVVRFLNEDEFTFVAKLDDYTSCQFETEPISLRELRKQWFINSPGVTITRTYIHSSLMDLLDTLQCVSEMFDLYNAVALEIKITKDKNGDFTAEMNAESPAGASLSTSVENELKNESGN